MFYLCSICESMSLLAEQLIRKALAALSEVADECEKEPARKSLTLRFLLMYTFVQGGADPKQKWIWDSFWEAVTRPKSKAAQDEYIRGRDARSALDGICRESATSPMWTFYRISSDSVNGSDERVLDATVHREAQGATATARRCAPGGWDGLERNSRTNNEVT